MSGMYEIWKDDEGKLSEEKLQAYLNGTLSEEEQREIEILLSEENMESDAVEGLKQLPADAALTSVNKLNNQLHELTHKRKRKHQLFSENKWTLLAIIIILLLCIVGYVVIHMMK